ncbi:Modification methylase Eco47II, partial [Frankliniella fusca]
HNAPIFSAVQVKKSSYTPAFCYQEEKCGNKSLRTECMWRNHLTSYFCLVLRRTQADWTILARSVCDVIMTPHRTADFLSRREVWKKSTAQSDFQLYHSTLQFSSLRYNEPILLVYHGNSASTCSGLQAM